MTGDQLEEAQAPMEPITITLRFRPPRDTHNAAYYKPSDEDDGPGPSLWVNQSFVNEYFRGLKPEHAKLTLLVSARPPASRSFP